MARRPLTGLLSQYSKNAGGAAASGYWLKLYSPDSTSAILMYTLQSGGSSLAKCTLNSRGEPINNPLDDDSTFIPYVDRDYDAYLFQTEADADANNTAAAVFLGQNIQGDLVDYNDLPDYVAAEFATVSAMSSGTPLNDIGTVDFGDYVGRKVSTVHNNATSKAGGAEYVIWSLADYRTFISDPSWVPDGTGSPNHLGLNHYVGGTTYVAILKTNGLPVNVMSIGAIADADGNIGVGTDSGGVISSLDGLAREIFIPKGDYRLSSPIVFENDINIRFEKGSDLWVDEGITGVRLKANGSGIYGDGKIEYLKSSVTSFDANSLAIHLGADDVTQYRRAYTVRGDTGFIIDGATESIRGNTIFWLEFENIETFRDQKGLSLNKQNTNPNAPTTTLTMRRVYFHGGNGSKISGTQAIDARYVTDFDLYGCVTEWYPWLGEFREVQTGIVNKHYFEYCDAGLNFHTISGSVLINGPYANGIVSGAWAFQALFGEVKCSGGRGIIDAGGQFALKGTSGKIFFSPEPKIQGGGGVTGADVDDTVIDGDGISAEFYKNANSTITAPVFISGEASLTKTVSVNVNHGSQSSWRAWYVECSVSLTPDAGGTLLYQNSARAARKLNTSIVQGVQENFTATTTLFTINVVHVDSENTRVDVAITSPSTTWGAVGSITVASGNGFGYYFMS